MQAIFANFLTLVSPSASELAVLRKGNCNVTENKENTEMCIEIIV